MGPLPLLAGLGVGAGLIYLFTKDSHAAPANPPPNVPSGSELFDTAPAGELVYKPQVSALLLQQMSTFQFRVVDGDPNTVEVFQSTVNGIPGQFNNSTAKEWILSHNGKFSILAVRWMHVPVTIKKFLRAVPRGTENGFASANGFYAVLAYQGTLVPSTLPAGGGGGAVGPSDFPGGVPAFGPPGGNGGASGIDAYSELPEPLQTEIRDLDRNGGDPDKMIAIAAKLDQMGFKNAARALKSRAKALRSMNSIRDLERTYTVRSGDTGVFLAKWFTGTPGRWKEIPQFNDHLTVKTIGGVTQISPWIPGETKFVLPPGWDETKGNPPKQGGGKGGGLPSDSGGAKKPAGAPSPDLPPAGPPPPNSSISDADDPFGGRRPDGSASNDVPPGDDNISDPFFTPPDATA